MPPRLAYPHHTRRFIVARSIEIDAQAHGFSMALPLPSPTMRKSHSSILRRAQISAIVSFSVPVSLNVGFLAFVGSRASFRDRLPFRTRGSWSSGSFMDLPSQPKQFGGELFEFVAHLHVELDAPGRDVVEQTQHLKFHAHDRIDRRRRPVAIRPHAFLDIGVVERPEEVDDRHQRTDLGMLVVQEGVQLANGVAGLLVKRQRNRRGALRGRRVRRVVRGFHDRSRREDRGGGSPWAYGTGRASRRSPGWRGG